ncbi:MAG: hypothetical protein ACYTF1_03840 [Planctomycetota bacterium]
MKTETLANILRNFRLQMFMVNAFRLAIILALLAVIIWTNYLPEQQGKLVMLITVGAAVLTWVFIIIGSARTARELQAGTALLGMGQLDDAQVWLIKAVENFSLSVKGKIVACQQLAVLFMKQQAYEEVVTVCRTILSQRLHRLQSVWVNTRIMLADSLLYLNRVQEAYEAMRPVYDATLSLADRLKLLPVQLRYELATDRADSSVVSLKEKIQIAELLDSAGAALVHALLAEACRRRDMTAESNFLIQRARLYHDLDKLVQQHGSIAPVVENNNVKITDSPEEPV